MDKSTALNLAKATAIIGIALFMIGIAFITVVLGGFEAFFMLMWFPYSVSFAGLGLFGFGLWLYRWQQKQATK